MAKYNIVELSVRGTKLVDFGQKRNEEKQALISQNAIYIYRSSTTKKVYIGQTVHFVQRHNEHYDGTEIKFNNAHFNQVIVIFSQYFNRSALDDVESQLITYFSADCGNANGAVSFDSSTIINGNGGNSVNEYKDRGEVATKVIIPLWEKVLYPKGWVKTQTLEKVRTKELVRYSPIKVLSTEQDLLIHEIYNNPQKNYVINGDAGTGKTVLLTHLVAYLMTNRPNATIGVIVQPNWEETGQRIFKVFGMNSTRLTVTTSTKLISSYSETHQQYDIIVIDESHKLSRKYGKQHPSFNSVYSIPDFHDCESHLEILQRIGGQIVLMYDVLQAVRPANITRTMFQSLTSEYEKRFLTTQFRIQASNGKNYTSEDYINGIKYLLFKDTGLLSTALTNYNPNFNRDVFKESDPDSYFGYYTDQPLHNLFDWVEEDRNFHPEHVNRVLAGLVEDWQQSDGKDPNIYHWFEGDMKCRWNSSQENWINSTEPDAQEQIGSIFSVQGIDLNKVGVLIGDDIKVTPDGKLAAEPSNFKNRNGVFTSEEMEEAYTRDEFTLLVLNSYYVLLTRGIDGIRLGFWRNDKFKEYMEDTLDIK